MKKCTEYTIGTTRIIQSYDPDPDTSYLGEYGRELKPGCIIRVNNTFYEDLPDDFDKEDHYIRGEYPYFYPPDNGEKPGTPDYKKYALQDQRAMDDLNNQQWTFIILTVSTTITTNTGLTDHIRNSLSGIEDHWDKDSDAYKEEIIKDLIAENTAELLKMGFTADEIKKSTDNPVYPKDW